MLNNIKHLKGSHWCFWSFLFFPTWVFNATILYYPTTVLDTTQLPGMTVYTYNPTYSGGRDEKDWGLRPAPAKC
jgi:hypothetical protein